MIIPMTPGTSYEERTLVNLSTASQKLSSYSTMMSIDASNNDEYDDFEHNANRKGNDFIEYNDNKSKTI